MEIKERIQNIIRQKRQRSNDEITKIKEQIKKMAQEQVSDNCILIIAPHIGHGELHPSLINYFDKLGYNTHLVILDSVYELNSLCKCNFPKLKIFPFVKMPTDSTFFELCTRYKAVLIDTLCTHEGYYFIEEYEHMSKNKNTFAIIHEVKEKNSIYIENEFIDNKKAFVLKDNIFYHNQELPFLAPLYLGDTSSCKRNNNFTNFIVIGGGNKKNLRNFNKLFSAIDKLIENNYKNFKVNIIGVTEDRIFGYINQNNKNYINNLGILSFPDMIEYLEKSDFILFNIDSECIDYKKYLKGGITGSYSLSLIFLLPAIIEENLAISYNLKDKSLTYTEDLYNCMKKAINMDKSEYNFMQQKLKKLKNDLESRSIRYLEEFLN